MHPVLDINPHEVRAALTGLVAVNVQQIREGGPQFWPGLYASGVRYMREPRGKEEWRNIRDLKRYGNGDCEDLASALVAEWQVAGELGAYADAYESAPGVWHVRAYHADGSYEDPSAKLGMLDGRKRSPMRSTNRTMRRRPVVLGADPNPGAMIVTFEVVRNQDGSFHGTARIPMGNGQAMYAQSPGSTPQNAMLASLQQAGKVLTADPALMAKLPPAANFAVTLATSPTAQAIANGLFPGAGMALNLAKNPQVQNAASAAVSEVKSLMSSLSNLW